jgi:hypothetical protein
LTGSAALFVNDTTVNNGRLRPWFVQVDLDGYLLWDHIVDSIPNYWDATSLRTEPSAMEHRVDENTQEEHFVVSGFAYAPPTSKAWVMYINEPISASGFVEPTWVRDSHHDNSQFPDIRTDKLQISTDVKFMMEQGVEKVIWPVVANITGVPYAGDHWADNGLIYKIPSANPNTVEATADLGELHAFDLRLGVTITSDNNVAAVCTKWPEGKAVPDSLYGYGDLSQAQRACLLTVNPDTAYWNNVTGFYYYWGSQSYATKLNGSDLSEIWHYQWNYPYNENGSTADDCFPGNVRRRQCNFRVIEAPDGGLVVCGNTGHNFDDAYLAKLRPCDQITEYADLPLDANGEHHITGYTVWNTDMNVKGSIVVDPYGHLTVDGATIGFADSRQTGVLTNIVVQPGGTFVLANGGVLTTVSTCDNTSMWDGVKVLANAQGLQGDAEVLTGTIRNALTGILSGEGDPMNPGWSGPVPGGVVHAGGCTFENNLHDVVLQGLPNGMLTSPYGASFFTDCQFTTANHLNYPDLDPMSHIRMADRNFVVVQRCQFANDIGTHTESQRMGLGIEAMNSNLIVTGDAQDLNSSFRNLDHAIHSFGTGISADHYTEVRNSEFIDNICGVYLADVPGFSVHDNVFSMGKWEDVQLTGNEDPSFLNYQRGIFSTGGYAFSIMDNTLDRSAGNTTPLEGIVVGYTRDNNEVVYRNQASNLDIGFVGEGICVGDNPDLVGLQFQCNENFNNAVDIKSRIAEGDPQFADQHTIRSRQGTLTYDAGNSFDGPMHFEVATRSPLTPFLNYFSAEYNAPVTYTHEDPGDPDANYLVPVSTPSSGGCETTGPVHRPAGDRFSEVRPAIVARKLAYGNNRYLLDQAIDGGHTDEVVLDIISAWPEDIWQLRDQLLNESPYLSVEVLQEVVKKPEIPLAIKAEICIANPEATQKEGFLKWAEFEAVPPLPGYILNNIRASWDTKTYRTTLEEHVADSQVGLTQAANYALELLHTTEETVDPDTVRWVWQQVRTPAARYAEAALLLGQARYSEAKDLILDMPLEKELKPKEEDERGRMITYIDVLAVAADQERNAYQLNQAEVATLETMIDLNYDRPSNWASNLLCAVYGKCRAPYTGEAKDQPQARMVHRDSEAAPLPSSYGVLPNPARGWAAFNYDRKEVAPGDGTITVREVTGKVVATLPMHGPIGQQVWYTRSVAPGTYLVEFRNAKEALHTEKLIVQ